MYPQVFGKYVLERELATGGMARVLLATLRGAGGFEKKLVVKQIRDELAVDHEFVQRFVEEAKTTVALSHPNIVPVYELGIELGTYYLAMELVDGVSVDRLLRKGDGGKRVGLTPEQGAYVGVEVCRALDYAHRRMQVVHRDITPRNVMVDEEGQVKLIDFGIAARASVAGHDVFGTPGHMPPEQMRREAISPATDIFAVAVLLMELWGGEPPFRRKTAGESLAQMHSPHPKPSDIDPRLAPLDSIIAKAMALVPTERPQHADELGRALRKFLQDVDQGDVEREIGARVHSARAETDAKRSRTRPDGSLIKPSKPSMPDMGPKTFAVRAEALAWKAETPEEPTGTRRLPASEPPPPPESDAPRVETIATRPIETPVRIEEPIRAASPSRRTGVIVALLLAPAVAWGVLRFQGTPDVPIATTKQPTPITPATTAPTSTSTAPTLSTTTPASTPTTPATTPANPTPASIPSASAAPVVATGQIFLVGDPGTEAAVDSAPFRPCPVAITVKAGLHQIRFAFGYATAHDSVGREVVVGANERVTVRADFTAAVPRIRIER
jgi:eukaryotic-like serine/threonine-protein kinase